MLLIIAGTCIFGRTWNDRTSWAGATVSHKTRGGAMRCVVPVCLAGPVCVNSTSEIRNRSQRDCCTDEVSPGHTRNLILNFRAFYQLLCPLRGLHYPASWYLSSIAAAQQSFGIVLSEHCSQLSNLSTLAAGLRGTIQRYQIYRLWYTQQQPFASRQPCLQLC